jgi:protein gp37
MSTSRIEWTQKTWNPTLGCTEKSPGCTNCYAAKMAWRLMHMNTPVSKDYTGTVKKLPGGRLVWTGKVNMLPHKLIYPLTVKKPTIFFVDSMSDLFHEDIPFSFITSVLAVMALCPQHTFQVLTKRAERMHEYFEWLNCGVSAKTKIRMETLHGCEPPKWDDFEFPLKNLWLGVSVEDQKRADERIPFLVKTPAAVRFLSCEPLLASVDLLPVLDYPVAGTKHYKRPIDWVIVGGESGPDARPMHPKWLTNLQLQCLQMGAVFFFKQWGTWITIEEYKSMGLLDGSKHYEQVVLDSGQTMIKVGKKPAGRRLHGKLYNEMPVLQ